MKIPVYSASDIPGLAKKHRQAQTLVLAGLAGLIAIYSGQTLIENNSDITTIVSFWLIRILPLAVFIPGILKQHYRNYSWLCFVILWYFTAEVVHCMSPGASVQDFFAVSLTVIIFCSAMMASRWRQHQLLAERQNPQ